MIEIPSGEQKLIPFANELIEHCHVSQGMRAAYYRTLNTIAETGRYDGTKSLINLLQAHLKRTAAHLYSPVELKFNVDFERPRRPIDYARAREVGKTLTRTWERNGTANTYTRGVFEALKYGACFLKQWPQIGNDALLLYDKLVMPWQFGVYREDENRLDRQEALCETQFLTGPEVWSRIYHLPDAKKLYDRIMTHAKAGEAGSEPNSFFHQVLSTSQIQTGVQGASRPLPGGIVQLNNDPNYSIMGPVIGPGTVRMHELWVKGETDYVTIQMVDPDVLIAPKFKRANLLNVPCTQPYRLIQPNEVTNWIWGRSELVDLIEPQGLLSAWAEDTRRMYGLQIDKIMAFVGEGGMTDELYAQFRMAGYTNLAQGADIKDVTPQMPQNALDMLKFVIDIIDRVGGFTELMQGRGEPGVRAGVHAGTLLKTGSPTLRDRSLLVEQQCATAADLTLQIMEAKDKEKYWTQEGGENPLDVASHSFLLADLPDDWRVTVDSHSSSPIFADENAQLIFQGHKDAIVGPDYVLDNMPFPNKEAARVENKRIAENKANTMKGMMENPVVREKVQAKLALKSVG